MNLLREPESGVSALPFPQPRLARCHTVPVNSNVKRIVFSPGGGQLLQGLARASRMRLLASLAYLERASTDMEVDEAIAFLIAAPDNLILERVLAQVEGPDTAIAPGLKALPHLLHF